MRRSLLFIPANSPAMMQNADVFGADTIIFDLEDAISEEEKDAARILLSSFLEEFPYENNFEVVVRINSFDYFDLLMKDLDALNLNYIDTIMLPKASISNIKDFCKLLTTYENKWQKKKKTMIIPIIELTSSLLEVNEIAKHKRVDGLLLGGEDFSTDLEVERTLEGDEIFLARSMVILAAKANRIDAIDTPFTDVNDQNSLIYDAKKAKSLGMNAKSCIHPNQIETVNNIFSPSISEISNAKKVLEAEQLAKKEGKGVFSVDGKMVDKPILDRARKIIEKAKKWNL